MLLRTVFLCIACTALAETMLQASAALAVTAAHRRGLAAAATALADALQHAQAIVADAASRGASLPAPVPSPVTTCASGDSTPCALDADESVTFSTPEPTACASAGCSSFGQENDAVVEGRVLARLQARVSDRNGSVVAQRGEEVVFRTLRVPPYAIAAGVIDATPDDGESGPGDASGIPPNALGAGTLIDVLYENAATGTLMPANVWRGFQANTAGAGDWSP